MHVSVQEQEHVCVCLLLMMAPNRLFKLVRAHSQWRLVCESVICGFVPDHLLLTPACKSTTLWLLLLLLTCSSIADSNLNQNLTSANAAVPVLIFYSPVTDPDFATVLSSCATVNLHPAVFKTVPCLHTCLSPQPTQ